MSRTIHFLIISILLWGCTTGAGGPRESASSPRAGGELVIRDFMETYLPRAAYMAKFEVFDEIGVSLLFPIRQEDFQQVGPGIHRMAFAPPSFVGEQRDKYVSRITGLLNQGPRPLSSVLVLVVISDQPFDLDPFLESPGGIRDHLGGTIYINDIRAVETILGTIIGDPGTAVTEYRIESVPIPSGPWFRR